MKGHQSNLKLRLFKNECVENKYISWMYLAIGYIFYSKVENVFPQMLYATLKMLHKFLFLGWN